MSLRKVLQAAFVVYSAQGIEPPQAAAFSDLLPEYVSNNRAYTLKLEIHPDSTLTLGIEGKVDDAPSWICRNQRFEYKSSGRRNMLDLLDYDDPNNCIRKIMDGKNVKLRSITHSAGSRNRIAVNVKRGCCLFRSLVLKPSMQSSSQEANHQMMDGDEMIEGDEHAGQMADASQLLDPISNEDASVDANEISDLSQDYVGRTPRFTARVVFNADQTLDMAIEGTPGVRSWSCKNEPYEYKKGSPNSLRLPGLQDRENCIRKNMEKSKFKLRSIWHWSTGNYLSVNVRHRCCLYYSLILRAKSRAADMEDEMMDESSDMDEQEPEDQMVEGLMEQNSKLEGKYEGWNPKFTPRMIVNKDSTFSLSFEGKAGASSWVCMNEPFKYIAGTPNSLSVPGMTKPDNCIRKNLEKAGLQLQGIWHWSVGGNYVSLNVKQGLFLYYPIILRPTGQSLIPSIPGVPSFPGFSLPQEVTEARVEEENPNHMDSEGNGIDNSMEEGMDDTEGDMTEDDELMGHLSDASQMLPGMQGEESDQMQNEVDAAHVSSLSRQYIGKNRRFTARVIFNRDRTLDMAIEGAPGVRSWHCKGERFEYKEGTPNSLYLPDLRNRNNCIRRNMEQSKFKLRSIWHWSVGNRLSVNVRHRCCLYYSLVLGAAK